MTEFDHVIYSDPEWSRSDGEPDSELHIFMPIFLCFYPYHEKDTLRLAHCPLSQEEEEKDPRWGRDAPAKSSLDQPSPACSQINKQD